MEDFFSSFHQYWIFDKATKLGMSREEPLYLFNCIQRPIQVAEA